MTENTSSLHLSSSPDPPLLAENEVPKVPDAMLAIASQSEEWKADQTKRLLRKADWRLLPLLIAMYLLNFLDRSNLAQARLGTLEKDLNMKGTDFNTATSILFVGYLTMQLPANLLLTRVKPAIFLGLAMAAWGVVSAAQAATESYAGLIICRFILGILEAPFFPGSVFLLSCWYTRAELAYRIAWFYSGSSIANMFGGLLAAAVLGNLEGAHEIAGWRWLFIIEGVTTVGIALIAVFVLPNYPQNSKWLTEDERLFAQWRIQNDANESDTATSVSLWSGLLLILKDYRLYIFLTIQHVSILTQTFQYFFPTIVKTLGFGKTATLLLTAPVWFLTFLASLVVTYSSGKTGDRSIHIICLLLISCIGNVMVVSSLNTGVRFFAMFLMPLGAVPAYQIIITWVSNSFPRPMVKRSAAIAICNMIGNAGNIYGPYFYPAADGPRYLAGGAAVAGLCVLVAILAYVLRLIHIHENKELARLEEENVQQEGDQRGIGFRYLY